MTDIADKPLSGSDNYGTQVLSDVRSLQIGAGASAVKADWTGLWAGADKMADAPFSVDMDGNIIATGLDLSGYISKAGTGQQLGGSIIINDGANDRILIGYQLGGF